VHPNQLFWGPRVPTITGFFFLSNLESWVGWQSNKRGLSHFVRFGENYKNEDFILFLEFPL
jgi:hypothetical protein